jgi:hypothetical protein
MNKELTLRLSIVGIYDSKIMIFDIKEQKIVEVRMTGSEGSLQCLSCKSDECLHAGFAFGILASKKSNTE